MGDPTMRDVDGVRWWGSTTPSGAATLALLRLPDRAVRAQAWGPGAQWVLDRVPAVLGAHDDPSSVVSHHDRVSAARRRDAIVVAHKGAGVVMSAEHGGYTIQYPLGTWTPGLRTHCTVGQAK